MVKLPFVVKVILWLIAVILFLMIALPLIFGLLYAISVN